MFSGQSLVSISDFVGRQYVLEIQDGSQLNGSSNISETMTHITKMPTATPIFSGTSFLVMALPISWDVDVR